jgi:hypothetical protein
MRPAILGPVAGNGPDASLEVKLGFRCLRNFVNALARASMPLIFIALAGVFNELTKPAWVGDSGGFLLHRYAMGL